MKIILLFKKFFYKILPTKPQTRLNFLNPKISNVTPLFLPLSPLRANISHPSQQKTAIFDSKVDPTPL